MTSHEMHARRLTSWDGGIIVTSVAVALIGGLFALEGLMGHFYNTSMFWEGLNHMWEIFGGLTAVVAGLAVATYDWLRR